jgi:chromosome segregation ATPase
VKLDVARVRDIEKEMESRLRPLKAQANAANRYSTILAERWTLQLLLHKDDVRRAGIEVTNSTQRRDAAKERVFNAEKAATELRAERDTADAKLKEAMEQAEAARSLLQRIGSVKERLRIRQQAFVDRAAAMRRGAAAGRARADHAGRELDRCERELKTVSTRLAEVRERVADLSKQRDEAVKQIQGLEQLFADERQSGRELAQLEGRVAVLRERRENLDTRISRVASELGTLRGQRTELKQRQERLVAAREAAEKAVAETLAAKTTAEQSQTESQTALDSARAAADAARADAAKLEERQAMAVARIELLTERLAKVEAASDDDHGFQRVADSFDVRSGAERALAVALADDAEALIVPSREELVAFATRVAGRSVRAFVPQGAARTCALATVRSRIFGVSFDDPLSLRRSAGRWPWRERGFSSRLARNQTSARGGELQGGVPRAAWLRGRGYRQAARPDPRRLCRREADAEARLDPRHRQGQVRQGLQILRPFDQRGRQGDRLERQAAGRLL